MRVLERETWLVLELSFTSSHAGNMPRRNRSLGLLLGAVAARANCYLKGGLGAPKSGAVAASQKAGAPEAFVLPCQGIFFNCYSLSARASCFN